MAARRARSPFVWLRRVLLVLGVLLVAALVVLLAAYRFGRQEAPPDDTPLPAESGMPQQGKGFDYTQYSDGEPMFRIRAERSRQDREENAFLEGVLLDVYREDGEAYTITSQEAVFRARTRSAELRGDVFLRAWDELELRARGLLLEADGQVLTSEGAVELRLLPDLEGRASSLRVDREADLLTLGEGVHLRTVPEAEEVLRLDCETLIYRRGAGLVRAHGDVYLQRGEDELRAMAVSVFSEDGFDTIDSLRARFDVSGTLYTDERESGEPAAGAAALPAADRQRVDFRGDLLDLAPAAEGATTRRVLLEAADGETAQIRIAGGNGSPLVREIAAIELVGILTAEGDLASVDGRGDPLTLIERAPTRVRAAATSAAGAATAAPALRSAAARRARALFLPDGRLGTVELEGGISMREPRLALGGGERALVDMTSGRVTVTGDAVELERERARVVAPSFVYDRDSGVVRATGGVQAAVEEEGLGGLGDTPFGQGEGPIRVTAEQATWTEQPPTVVFRDAVRAWRAQNLLLAEQLRADQDAEEMAAAGGVKTVWLPEARSAVTGERTPIEVTAESVTYRERDGDLTYRGDVEVRQGRRQLDCRELTVELDEDGAAERMICREQVRLEDPESSRLVLGDRAVYTLDSGLVEVFGEPVRMRDAEQNLLEGKYLRYDVESGSAQLRSEAPSAGVDDAAAGSGGNGE